MLSQRQFEILKLLSEGFTQKEVASQLDIKTRTVEYHINNINIKLNANNTAHAVAIAYRTGIFETLQP